MGYVVMNASAKYIAADGVAFVYIAGILPCLLVQITLPYWQHQINYDIRMYICAILMFLSYIIVASTNNTILQLIGVAFSSAQSGLGEPSMLALSSRYGSRTVLTMWSSGTGMSG